MTHNKYRDCRSNKDRGHKTSPKRQEANMKNTKDILAQLQEKTKYKYVKLSY